jgi:hypothetical protein
MEALGLPTVADRGYDRINEGMFPDGLTEEELNGVRADGGVLDRAARPARADAYLPRVDPRHHVRRAQHGVAEGLRRDDGGGRAAQIGKGLEAVGVVDDHARGRA